MELINGNDLYQMFNYGAYQVVQERIELNNINVFPVADGDTGDNLTQTLRRIVKESEQSDSFHQALKEISESALIGARGNSGVIFAQFVNGLQANDFEKDQITIEEFADLVQQSYSHTVASLSNPVEGTMITILREWGDILKRLSKTPIKIKDVFIASFEHVQKVLQNTPKMLNVLSLNKVVDSGAYGFVLFVKGIVSYYNNDPLSTEEHESVEITSNHHDTEVTFRYCTEGLVKYDTLDKDILEKELTVLGDSLIIAQGKERFRVHIHTNTPELLFDTLKNYGVIENQKIDDMVLEVHLNNTDKKRVLITDSIADLDKKYIEDNNIVVIPVNISLDQVEYKDKLSISNELIFNQLNTLKEYPKTATPSIKFINDLFSKLLLKFEELIVVTVSHHLSGTHQIIKNEAEKLIKKGKKVYVIDSLNNSASQGLIVQKAVDLLDKNLPSEEIVKALESYREKTQILVCLSTFKYAMMGGRVPKIIGKIAMFFGIRPIMSLDKGKGTAYGMSLSQKGITKRIKKLVQKDLEATGIETYAIVHCMNEKLAEEYTELFTKMIGFAPASVSEISSATAINSGVGSVAVGYIKK